MGGPFCCAPAIGSAQDDLVGTSYLGVPTDVTLVPNDCPKLIVRPNRQGRNLRNPHQTQGSR
jgi:hypothetical protein